MAALNWGSQDEVSIDQIFQVWDMSPLKVLEVYNFGEFVEVMYKQRGYRVI